MIPRDSCSLMSERTGRSLRPDTPMMGYIICQLWPASSLWVIGLFVGIDLIMNGATWSVIAIGIRNKSTPTLDLSVLVL